MSEAVEIVDPSPRPAGPQPTRYALHLRRQATNRARAIKGKDLLPVIRPGNCSQCAGWGVETKARVRCDACGGTGMRR